MAGPFVSRAPVARRCVRSPHLAGSPNDDLEHPFGETVLRVAAVPHTGASSPSVDSLARSAVRGNAVPSGIRQDGVDRLEGDAGQFGDAHGFHEALGGEKQRAMIRGP